MPRNGKDPVISFRISGHFLCGIDNSGRNGFLFVNYLFHSLLDYLNMLGGGYLRLFSQSSIAFNFIMELVQLIQILLTQSFVLIDPRL